MSPPVTTPPRTPAATQPAATQPAAAQPAASQPAATQPAATPPPQNGQPQNDAYLGAAPKIDLRLRFDPNSARGSGIVSTLGESASRALDGAAEKDILGPEARGRTRIRALTQSALDGIRPLEERASKLPAGSRERQAVEREIDERVNMYRNGLNAEVIATERDVRAHRGNAGADAFKKSLPAFMREAIDRKGLAIPGVPGGFVPRTDNGTFNVPSGVNWRIRF